MQTFGTDAFFNFNAGHVALTNGLYVLAAYRFLNCAMRQRFDSEAWALAVASAFKAGDAVLTMLAITSGYFFVKEKLLVDFFRVTQFFQADATSQEQFRRMFAETVHASQSKSRHKSMTVRFIGPDSTNVFEV
jgi:hypothetical protein